jgi:hypothetical protein
VTTSPTITRVIHLRRRARAAPTCDAVTVRPTAAPGLTR